MNASGERPADAGQPESGDDVSDLSAEIAALIEQHPQLEDVAAGLGDLHTAPVSEQHDRLAEADDRLRAILDDVPPASAAP